VQNIAGTTPLPLMTMQLQGLLQSAFMPPFRIGDYMGNLPLGVQLIGQSRTGLESDASDP
jgi:hypothetical protein